MRTVSLIFRGTKNTLIIKIETSLETVIDTPTQEIITEKPSDKLKPQSFYSQKLRAELPSQIFEPYRARILLAVSYWIVAGLCLYAISISTEWGAELPLALV